MTKATRWNWRGRTDTGTILHHNQRVLACVDQSHFAEYVADYAAWAAAGLALPLEFLHILERHQEVGSGSDHSGSIGLQSQEALMEALVQREAAESRVARERGREFLATLRARVMTQGGLTDVSVRQRYGDLEATLVEQQPGTTLFVLGRRGESAESTGRDLGRNLERVVRALQRPILAVSEAFRPPERGMLAFDGGATTRRGVELIASNAVLRAMTWDIVMAGETGRRGASQLAWAGETLAAAGVASESLVLPGDPEREITGAIRTRGTDLLAMGAYGHSLWQRVFRGSKTADLLRAATVPTLLLR